MENDPVIQAAEQYVQQSPRYLSMKEIGKQFGVSSHVVGRKLKEIGLRTADGKPSLAAIEGGYTKKVPMFETFALDVWHEKTLKVLRPLIEKQKE